MVCEKEISINRVPPEQMIPVGRVKGEQDVQVCKECIAVVPFEDRDYNKFYNKPQINGVELVGNRLSKEIHVQHEMDRITEQGIDEIIYA